MAQTMTGEAQSAGALMNEANEAVSLFPFDPKLWEFRHSIKVQLGQLDAARKRSAKTLGLGQ